jgi:hypothetical protein
LARADAQHRRVGVRIVADQIRLAAHAVGKGRLDPARAVHHVAVREEQPVGGEGEA